MNKIVRMQDFGNVEGSPDLSRGPCYEMFLCLVLSPLLISIFLSVSDEETAAGGAAFHSPVD